MAEAKTQATGLSVEAFIETVEPAERREDARVLDALFRKVTGKAPKMWGPSIIGYGEYSTVYDSGRAVTSLKIGFSPRKAKHSLYLSGGYGDPDEAARRADALARLGKHSTGRSCIYVTRLKDVDMGVLEDLIAGGWHTMQRVFPEGGAA
jgi:hypothetical protein